MEEMLKSITIEVPIDVAVAELRDLFETPKSVRMMSDILPDFGTKHKVIQTDHPTHVVYDDGGLRSTVDLVSVGNRTKVTIRIPHASSDSGRAEVSMLAQLCAFESLEQGYKAGVRKRKS